MLGEILGFIGDVFGASESKDAAEDAREHNAVLQREFAQHGIRWRVADAKAAGVHPLYALGSGVTPYSPTIGVGGETPDYGKMGQNLGRAIQAGVTGEERQTRELQRRLLLSQIDEHDARAQLLRSQAGNPQPASNALPTASSGSQDWSMESGAQALPYRAVADPVTYQLKPGVDPNSVDFPGRFGMFKPKAQEVESANPAAPWQSAGPARPGFGEFRVTKNMVMLLPLNEEGWSEGLESVPYWMYPMVYKANVDKYGPHFWRLFAQEVLPFGRTRFGHWLLSRGLVQPASFGESLSEGSYVRGARSIRR